MWTLTINFNKLKFSQTLGRQLYRTCCLIAERFQQNKCLTKVRGELTSKHKLKLTGTIGYKVFINCFLE